jgi:hypothetical protein
MSSGFQKLRDIYYRYLKERVRQKFISKWHSFDRHPWKHPWLKSKNLCEMREYSLKIKNEVSEIAYGLRHSKKKQAFAFICNMANSMYTTSIAMRKTGFPITVFPHPNDDFIMSQPEWEEYAGSIPEGIEFTLSGFHDAGIALPKVSGVERIRLLDVDCYDFSQMPKFVSKSNYLAYSDYYHYKDLYKKLRDFDALYAIQSPYLAYLADKPYIVTHAGGDIWYECSRDDQLGYLQRVSFESAGLSIASNPWSYAFARRYGFKNMVQVPTLIDSEIYSPGFPKYRHEWHYEYGGNFFILSTNRLDDFYKGNNISIDAIAHFLHENDNARFVQIFWGREIDKFQQRIKDYGLDGKVILLPAAGKRKLIDYLRSAHVVIDQLTLGYYGMTALESIAIGVPVIMNVNQQQYDAFSVAGAPPVCNASNSREIISHLRTLYNDPNFASDISKSQRNWFMFYSGDSSWAEYYADLMMVIGSGHKINYSSSPLNAPLTIEEVEYHRSELEMAPIFPNYN